MRLNSFNMDITLFLDSALNQQFISENLDFFKGSILMHSQLNFFVDFHITCENKALFFVLLLSHKIGFTIRLDKNLKQQNRD